MKITLKICYERFSFDMLEACFRFMSNSTEPSVQVSVINKGHCLTEYDQIFEIDFQFYSGALPIILVLIKELP
ncbi:hypothetical protein E2N92_02880 [Methanofollis formosanus]|uniref:Uncharacterized protein n=1 Tax=Methanofollis formosanus TaxID=299308 RepID=A0A8G1EF03_9EURY|nr:hypothetical protein [Methanofollis formosanus]QYZ78448.1 hypothetical protein E2N92_02880 [Methanofollis formosanus]